MTTPPAHLYENWMRSQLQFDICVSEALNDIVHNTHNDPSYVGLPRDGVQLFNVMSQFKNQFEQPLRYVIHADQWDVLCPSSGSTDSKQFDVTLNVPVIRYNNVHFPPPTDPQGWQAKIVLHPVNKADYVLVARQLRNESKHGTISDMNTKSKYDSRLAKIEALLVGLGYQNMKLFEDLKTGSIEPYFNQILKKFNQKISDIEKKVDANDASVISLKQSLVDMKNERCFIRAMVYQCIRKMAKVEMSLELTSKTHDVASKTNDVASKILDSINQLTGVHDTAASGSMCEKEDCQIQSVFGESSCLLKININEGESVCTVLLNSRVLVENKDYALLQEAMCVHVKINVMNHRDSYNIEVALQSMDSNRTVKINSFKLSDSPHERQRDKMWLIGHAQGNSSDGHAYLKQCGEIKHHGGEISLGAGRLKDLSREELDEISVGYVHNIIASQTSKILQFPPRYLIKDRTKCDEISDMFLKCLQSDIVEYGLVSKGYDASKHLRLLGIQEEDLERVNLRLSEESRNRILLYCPEGLNLLVNVRVTEGVDLESVQTAQRDCNEDLKALTITFSHYLKENGIILFGLTAAPNIASNDIQQKEVVSFFCGKCISINCILTAEILSDEERFKTWWEDKFKDQIIENYRFFDKNKFSDQELFNRISGEIMVVISLVSTCLPSVWGDIHQQISTLLLNKQQLEAIFNTSTKKIIRGGYGTGKSLVALEIIKNIYLSNQPSTLLCYACFDPWCLLDYYMDDAIKDLKTQSSNVKIECINMLELVKHYGKEPSISKVLTDLCEQKHNYFKEIHFVIDEVDGENFTIQEADNLKNLFQTHHILNHSNVVFVIQSLEKNRSLFISGRETKQNTSCFLQTGMRVISLEKSMRNTEQVNKVIKACQAGVTKDVNKYNHEEKPKLAVATASVLHGELNVNLENPAEPVDKSSLVYNTSSPEKSPNFERQELEVLAENLSAGINIASSEFISTEFSYCGNSELGHNITGDYRPNFWFLSNKLTKENTVFIRNILIVFLRQTIFSRSNIIRKEYPKVILCDDRDGCKLIEQTLNVLKVEFVVYAPSLFNKLPTKEERNEIMKRFMKRTCVLLTDSRGFRGREEGYVVIFAEKRNHYYRQLLPEGFSRTTAKLDVILFERQVENESSKLPSVEGIVNNVLENDKSSQIINKKFIKVEEEEGKEWRIMDDTFYCNVSCSSFKNLENSSKSLLPEFCPLLDAQRTFFKLKCDMNNSNVIRNSEGFASEGDQWDTESDDESDYESDYEQNYEQDYEQDDESDYEYSSSEDELRSNYSYSFVDMVHLIESRHPNDHQTFLDEISKHRERLYERVYGLTYLHWCAIYDRPSLCDRLLKMDCSIIDARGDFNLTALIYAVMYGSTSCVRVLLQHVANINAVDFSGNFVLRWAFNNQEKEVEKFFREVMKESDHLYQILTNLI